MLGSPVGKDPGVFGRPIRIFYPVVVFCVLLSETNDILFHQVKQSWRVLQ
jgi:hypothetical protein